MATDTMIRPEVQLGTCPRDGGDMFRQFDEAPHTWVCGRCGLITHGDPRDEAALWDAVASQ